LIDQRDVSLVDDYTVRANDAAGDGPLLKLSGNRGGQKEKGQSYGYKRLHVAIG
jgi:hypothetical protein